MNESVTQAEPEPGVSWPATPPTIEVAMEFACRLCGYKMRWASPRSGGTPRDFDCMARDFVSRHTHAVATKH